MTAKVFAEAVGRAGCNLARESFVMAIQGKKDMDLGGCLVDSGPGKHTGTKSVELTWLNGDGRISR